MIGKLRVRDVTGHQPAIPQCSIIQPRISRPRGESKRWKNELELLLEQQKVVTNQGAANRLPGVHLAQLLQFGDGLVY